jgi:asparagine synthase (glutamine-hydrolysing)
MCGIAGTTEATPEIIERFRRAIAHRGPDGDGVWRDESAGVALVHARLAIIDLSPDGAQPMHSPDGRFVITYNGEIYNYRALRAELEAAGERFSTQSDTEILIRILQREGVAGLGRVVGMFALALWDRAERRLLLARDRLGIKPLVWARLPEGGIAFASEIAALRAQPRVDWSLDRDALSDYLACLYVPAPRTIFQGVRKLPPGHVLLWQEGRLDEPRPYWSPLVSGTAHPSLDEAVEELFPVLRRAVADCMVADVPVGCFLSGGVDSSAIAALMAAELRRQGGPKLRSFTMTFTEKLYDEREAARAVAAHVGAEHTELPAASAMAELTPEMLDRFGEPFGNPTAFLIKDLARKAREHVTVALVGDGGDEVFAGYPRYAGGLLAQRWRRMPRPLRGGAAQLARFIPESSAGRHSLRRAREFLEYAALPDPDMYAAWVEYFTPTERQALLGLDRPPESPVAQRYRAAVSASPLDAMQETDLATFLPGNILAYGDAMSMAHALEARLPLIDHRLIAAVARLAPDLRFAHGKKTLLRALAKRLLPPDLVDRPKRGFNPPMGIWLKTSLAPVLAERLRPERMALLGLDWTPVARLLDEQKSGLRDHALKLWSLVVADAWRERANA